MPVSALPVSAALASSAFSVTPGAVSAAGLPNVAAVVMATKEVRTTTRIPLPLVIYK